MSPDNYTTWAILASYSHETATLFVKLRCCDSPTPQGAATTPNGLRCPREAFTIHFLEVQRPTSATAPGSRRSRLSTASEPTSAGACPPGSRPEADRRDNLSLCSNQSPCENQENRRRFNRGVAAERCSEAAAAIPAGLSRPAASQPLRRRLQKALRCRPVSRPARDEHRGRPARISHSTLLTPARPPALPARTRPPAAGLGRTAPPPVRTRPASGGSGVRASPAPPATPPPAPRAQARGACASPAVVSTSETEIHSKPRVASRHRRAASSSP